MTEQVDRSDAEAPAPSAPAAVTPADAADAARLVAFGLQPKLQPARDQEYAELLRRHREDPAFARLADAVAFTSDNPRSEDPAKILEAVVAGAWQVPADERGEVHVEIDRTGAIAWALRAAAPGDVVVVAGKGHEQGQEIGGVVHPFDDRVVVREQLGRLGWLGRSGVPS